jgi:hypothetical protein
MYFYNQEYYHKVKLASYYKVLSGNYLFLKEDSVSFERTTGTNPLLSFESSDELSWILNCSLCHRPAQGLSRDTSYVLDIIISGPWSVGRGFCSSPKLKVPRPDLPLLWSEQASMSFQSRKELNQVRVSLSPRPKWRDEYECCGSWRERRSRWDSPSNPYLELELQRHGPSANPSSHPPPHICHYYKLKVQ